MKKQNLTPVLAFVVAYLGSRAIFAASDFHYNMFRDSFDPTKFVVDIGVFGVLFAAAYWLTRKALLGKSGAQS